jgi:putative protease
MNKNNLEILAPAGDMERLQSALDYGADAVYLGGKMFGMRANPSNFSIDELKVACDMAHEKNVKVYLTVNTLPHEHEIKELPQFLKDAQNAGVDALIIADIGVLSIAKQTVPDMELHMSTQTGIVNSYTCNMLYSMGVKRAVLARELSLEEIKEIRANIPEDMELEVFVHGAMCVSFSGRCLLSAYMTNRDANRGCCAQPCRWKYSLVEEKRPGIYFPIEEDENGTYILNAKDMCMIDYIDELAKAGVTSFKIEGRAKSAYYVAVTTNAYHMAMKCYKEGIKTPQWIKDEVYKCSHREYSTGFFFKDNPPTQKYETSGYERDFEVIGVVKETKDGIVYCSQRNRFYSGDTVEILVPEKEPYVLTLDKIYDNEDNEVKVANHAMMDFYFKSDIDFPKNAIIRKEVKTEK